ncbi:hypothetical protein H8L32_22055 [Undibacterium sp. CY18W]|uniref:Uncharacterized protein n=1 Tax=Undibacterium hunanense TaxID=2762292 RepID=A0ABR6ZWC4_9BURK|nr:hypothetical protein [Undibacterium hunanense]MBC3920163.1 hypothetical protein [Undibacterium hunanense]
MKKFFYLNAFGILLGALSFPSQAAESDLENRLIQALSIKNNGTDRQAQSRPVITAYKQAGILARQTDARADYVDFYLLRKPASFMGHKLVLLEEEYMDTYVGCCVSPGMGLVVQVSDSTKNMQNFAEKNACTFKPHADVFDTLKTYGIKNKLPKVDYASLSCRERDAQK